jgi:hypothetical protein
VTAGPGAARGEKWQRARYLAIQNSRPQTIGYGLADSPLLRLAWIAEKVHERTDLPVDRDQLLTTVSLCWFTGSGTDLQAFFGPPR